MTHFRRRRQRKRYLLVKVRLFVLAAPTIKSSLKSVVGLVNLLGVAIYLEDMAFGTVPMIVGLVINLLGVAIYLEDMAFGTVPMIVGLVINLSGFALHDLRLVLQFRRP
jgi:uncharacterized protein YacL